MSTKTFEKTQLFSHPLPFFKFQLVLHPQQGGSTLNRRAQKFTIFCVIPTKRSARRNPFSWFLEADPSTPLRFAQDDKLGVHFTSYS